TAFRTLSGSAMSSSDMRSPPTCAWSTPRSEASPSSSLEPDASAQTSSSSFASMMSSAWRPIDPVAPKTAIRFTREIVGGLQLAEGGDHVIGGDPCEQERVDPVEHAAVAPEQTSRV